MIAACPPWRPVDLVWHVGEVHRFWQTMVSEHLQEPPAQWRPPRPSSGDDVFTWAEQSAGLLAEVLTGADPADPVWSWSPRKDVGFVIRRMAHETAVHRVDAEQAAGDAHAIEPDLAADGIDEYLELFLPSATADAPALGGTLHVHCTDAPGEWTVTPADDVTLVVTRDHTKADAALRGPASDLLLALWRRTSVEASAVEVLGDAAVAARFLARTDNR